MLHDTLIVWQDTQLERLSAARSESEAFACIAAAARELDFEYCAYGARLPLPLSKPTTRMLNNYPQHWQQRYAEQGYLAIDPTVAHGMRSVQPLQWSDQVFGGAPDLWEDARAHGLRVGWAQSCFDARGVGGLLTMARSGDDLSRSELRHRGIQLCWLVQAAHAAMSNLLMEHYLPAGGISLTAREVEVLRWSADGKTSGEVGDIIKVSERTVNFHINNCLLKLGVANKTAGVVKAAMLGLL